MSASTVSITPNQGPTTRAISKNVPASGSDVAAAAVVTTAENGKKAGLTAADTATSILRDARKTSVQSQGKKPESARKSMRPCWLAVVSNIPKNIAFLLVVLVWFVLLILWVRMNSGRDARDFEGKLSEVESFVKAMQAQVNAIDQKIDDGVSSVRRDLNEKMEKLAEETESKLKAIDVKATMLEEFMNEFWAKSLLTKEEFGEFFEELKKAKTGSHKPEVSLDDKRDYARKIVEEELEKHGADGLGMVDYALAPGGGKVVRHSEPYGVKKRGSRNQIAINAGAEKLISPSFGEPGHCFPLMGRSGFVEIRLRTAILPEAITLEHVAKSVAYDRSSAPKDCRVSGWLQGRGSSETEDNSKNMCLLTQFTYDLDKSNAQLLRWSQTCLTSLIQLGLILPPITGVLLTHASTE